MSAVNMSAKTEVFDAQTGERILVPFGEGLTTPDRDGIYCHKWSDQLYYKFPEEPGTGFGNVVEPSKMFLAELSDLDNASALKLMEQPKNTIRVTEDLIRFCVAGGVTPFLWGPPGHGKTSFVESFQMQRDENDRFFNVESEELSQIDATVINGMHYVDPQELVMRRSVPEVAAKIIATYRETGRVSFYLLDEITLAGNGQQGAALRTLTHGEMGGVSVAPYMAILIAANPKSTVRMANTLGEQVVNRGAHFAWFLSADRWYSRWKRGFVPEDEPRQIEREPSAEEKAFTRALFRNNPPGIAPFESSRDEGKQWSKDDLTPKTIEMSPRSYTDFLKVKKIIERVCRQMKIADAVRHRYIYRVAFAMLGSKWAESVLTTLVEEADLFGGYDEIVDRLDDIKFDDENLPDGYASGLLMKSNGSLLGTAEVSAVADAALEEITNRNGSPDDRTRALIVAWSCAISAAHTHTNQLPVVMNTIADMVQYLSNNQHLMEGMPEKITPLFVPSTLKDHLHSLISHRQ